MKIKFSFYVLAVVFIGDFSLAAKNEQKRRRPIIDSIAQDSDGNYIDQIASDSISYTANSNVVSAPENYPSRYLTASDEFKKSFSKEPKVQYVTPEPYNFSQDYISHSPKIHQKQKENFPTNTFREYTSLTHDEPKRVNTPKKKKIQNSDVEDYNYYFQESKRITARTTAKPFAKKAKQPPIVPKDLSEKYYKPQGPGAIITKDPKTNNNINTYHYYYPEEPSFDENLQQNFDLPSSTFAPSSSTTKYPKQKFTSRKKVQAEHTSTDSYQYSPVLQRPSEYTPTDNSHQDFFASYSNYESDKSFGTPSSATPSTTSPIKMMKPTKKANYYLPSSTMSPSPSSKPMRIRRPSTEKPFEEVKQFSVTPSPSTMPHFSTTRSPEIYKFSSPAQISSTAQSDFYIKPSTQATPSASLSPSEMASDDERTVVIRPKIQFNSFEKAEETKASTNQQSHQENFKPAEQRVIYKFVPDYQFAPNQTENFAFQSTSSSFPEQAQTQDFYSNLNQSTQADMDFYENFHKNYNYQYFTEQDAGKMEESNNDEGEMMKVSDHEFFEPEQSSDKQTAEKKNMYFEIDQESEGFHPNPMMQNLDDHEMPPPMNEQDNDAEASKNQYFVLYSVDEQEKRQKKQKKKQKHEPEVVYHHHQHQHEEKGEDFHHFDNEFDSEFDSELTNSDNVRIVDPAVRGGRPLEFTKDDYLRHIKQAVVQYMKGQNTKDSVSDGSNVKNQRYHESDNSDISASIKKLPSATSPSYKNTPSPIQYKQMGPMKLPKNVYTANRLKEAIEEIQESPQVDLTIKKSKQKPFDLSAIDVGQTYQHVSHFDHSAALKNVEEFDQSHVVNKPKLHFSQQTYHDINNLSYNQKQKPQPQESFNDNSDNEDQLNPYNGYMLANKYNSKGNQGGASSYSSMNFDSSKLPRVVRGQDDDDDDNKVDDPVDAPIQIINGIPVSNPYNIDLNTLKYMLGGIAQAEVNDQLKDLDESPSNNQQRFPSNWKNFPGNQMGAYTSNNPIYQVYGGQQENGQRQKKNSAQTGNHGNSNNNKQSKFPLVGSLLNFNKGKQNIKQQKNIIKNNQNYAMTDFSGWNNMNKKQRSEPQASSTNPRFVLRPMMRGKGPRDENLFQKGSINRARQPQLSTDMRPPPAVNQKALVRVTKAL